MPISIEDYERLASMVIYSPESGSIRWVTRMSSTPGAKAFNTKYSGRECGTNDGRGYIQINFVSCGRLIKIRAHRLAWFIAYGDVPSMEIDHIDGDKSNNKISNLRDVPTAINQRNARMQSNNTSGVTGVSWNRFRGKWDAHAKTNNKKHHLGRFSSKEEAALAANTYRAANEFTDRHGKPQANNQSTGA